MVEVIQQSKTDVIEVQRIHTTNSKDIAEGFIMFFTVNGINYHFITNSIEKTEEMINEIEMNKIVKTKIVMKTGEYFNQKLKRYIVFGVKVLSPLLIPVLLFRSSLGKIFTSNVLKQTEGINRPNVKFTDIAGLGNAKI